MKKLMILSCSLILTSCIFGPVIVDYKLKLLNLTDKKITIIYDNSSFDVKPNQSEIIPNYSFFLKVGPKKYEYSLPSALLGESPEFNDKYCYDTGITKRWVILDKEHRLFVIPFEKGKTCPTKENYKNMAFIKENQPKGFPLSGKLVPSTPTNP